MNGLPLMADVPDLDDVFAQLEAQIATQAPATLSPTPAPADAALDETPERREVARLDGAGVAITIRGGSAAKAIDVSETGILAETTSRLRPGGSVDLVLEIGGVRRTVRATVVRSTVHSLGPTLFRTAFTFDERIVLPEQN